MLCLSGFTFPSSMLIPIVAFLLIILPIVGLTLVRYCTRRQQLAHHLSTDSLHGNRRQLTRLSCDSLSHLPILDRSLSNQTIDETMRTMKNSMSWPETVVRHQQQVTSSSSSLSTVEHIYMPASLTFGIRWNPNEQILVIRLISAHDLYLYRHCRQGTIIDSYVRIELVSSSTMSPSSQPYFHHLLRLFYNLTCFSFPFNYF
jgi:hypothetical protein